MTQANLHEYATNRNAEAFAQIVEQYQRFVFITCRRKLHDPADLDDAVQETFLRLAQQAGKLHSNLGGWLHRCAVNVAIDLNRRRSSRQRHETGAAADPRKIADDPQRTLAELREHLDAALEKLDAQQRELIIQRYFLGRAQVELATEAGVSPSTITHRLEQAIANLRKHLQKMGCAAAAGGAAAMTGLIETETASAAVPQALTANLMKIGLSGVHGAAGWTAGTIFAAAGVKVAAIFLAVAAIAGSVWIITRPPQLAQVQAPTPPPAPAGITVQSGGTYQTPQPPRWQATQPATRPAVVSGRVLDQNGKPIANATVTLEGAGVANVKTDAEGNYSFAAIPRAGDYQVSVQAAGFLPIVSYRNRVPSLQLTPQSQARRDFVLDRGVTVLINVTDAAGQPIPKVSIDAGVRDDYRRGIERVLTNETGQCNIILPVSNAAYVITASSKGNAPAYQLAIPSNADKPLEVNIVLGKGLTISGVAICKDGKPASGWEIRAQPDWWASNYILGGGKIDAAGNFTLTDVVAGRNMLYVSIPTGEGSSTSHGLGTVMLPPTSQPWRVDIPMASPGDAGRYIGKIKFVGGNPEYVNVTARSLTDERGYYNARVEMGRTRSGARLPAGTGQYTFESLPRGSYRVDFESPMVETKVLEKVDVPGELPSVEIKVIGKPKITGTIVDAANGKPLDHFAVRARKIRTLGNAPNYVQDSSWTQVSDAQGRFSIELVGPGVYRVQASMDGYAWSVSEEVTVEAGGKPELQIKATAGATLSGQILDPAGKPVAAAKVIPLSRAGNDFMRGQMRFESDAGAAMTDETGRFTLAHLAAGDETIKVVHRDFAPLIAANLKVSEGQTTDAGVLKLQVGGAVEGIVYDGQGNPSPGATLQFQDESGYGGGGDEEAGRLATVSSDENGRFRVEHLPAQITYVNVAEMWQHDGVVRRTFHPIDGKTARLDFGGKTPVKGRLLDSAGSPMPSLRVELAMREPNFSPNTSFAKTDGDGRFAFFGPPVGQYTLYADINARGSWTALRKVQVADQPIDLGDVVNDLGDVIVKVTADDADAAKNIAFVQIETNDPSQAWQRFVTRATLEGGNWVVKNIPPGQFRAQPYLTSGQSSGLFPFERKAGNAKTEIEAHLPRRSASLTVRLTGGDKNGGVIVQKQDATFEQYVGAETAQPLKLPAGTYIVRDDTRLGPRQDIAPIVLADGESREIEVGPRPPEKSPLVSYDLRLWDASGVLLGGAATQLIDADGNKTPPSAIGDLGPAFIAKPGHYRLMIDQTIQEIDLPAPHIGPLGFQFVDVFVQAK